MGLVTCACVAVAGPSAASPEGHQGGCRSGRSGGARGRAKHATRGCARASTQRSRSDPHRRIQERSVGQMRLLLHPRSSEPGTKPSHGDPRQMKPSRAVSAKPFRDRRWASDLNDVHAAHTGSGAAREALCSPPARNFFPITRSQSPVNAKPPPPLLLLGSSPSGSTWPSAACLVLLSTPLLIGSTVAAAVIP